MCASVIKKINTHMTSASDSIYLIQDFSMKG